MQELYVLQNAPKRNGLSVVILYRDLLNMAKEFAKSAANQVALLLARAVLAFIPAAWRNRHVHSSLWAGTPIITLGVKARAERLLGIQSHSLVYTSYHLTNHFDFNLRRWMRVPVLRWCLPYCVLIWACCRYQRFHFFYDHGLLPSVRRHQFNPGELALLKQLGKEVFFWAYGADVRTEQRTRSLGEYHCCTLCPEPGQYCICNEEAGRENYERIHRHATQSFSLGDMTEYTPGSRNDVFYWPIDLNADGGARYSPRYPDPKSMDPLRIVHAANHRHFKGTEYLIEAVERLKDEEVPVSLILVENAPNQEALELYRSADLIFDQCLIGGPGYFAYEAMALGKPVMCFVRKPRDYLLSYDICPIVNTQPEKLTDDLRSILQNRQHLCELGVRGRRYVEEHFSMPAFAARLRHVYADIKYGAGST